MNCIKTQLRLKTGPHDKQQQSLPSQNLNLAEKASHKTNYCTIWWRSSLGRKYRVMVK